MWRDVRRGVVAMVPDCRKIEFTRGCFNTRSSSGDAARLAGRDLTVIAFCNVFSATVSEDVSRFCSARRRFTPPQAVWSGPGQLHLRSAMPEAFDSGWRSPDPQGCRLDFRSDDVEMSWQTVTD